MRTTGGSSPIPLPIPVRSNEPIRAAWANSVRDCLQKLRDRAGGPVPREPGIRPGNPLEVRGVFYDTVADSIDVSIEPGYVQEIKWGSQSSIFHPLEYSGGTHYANTVIDVSTGESIFAKYNVSNTGNVTTGTAEIVVESTDFADYAHWSPDDPEGAGTAGNVYVELAAFTVSGSNAVTVRKHDGNVLHYQDAWKGTNLTNASSVYFGRVYKQHDAANNMYEFRSITVDSAGIGITETGEEIIITICA